MRTRHSLTALAAVLAATLALPVAAQAGDSSHRLRIDRVERHLTLGGANKTFTVSCKSGFHAIQGMWRLDNVDQDDELSFHQTYTQAPDEAWLTAVDVARSESDPANARNWVFRFHKNAPGDAQLKLNVICLGNSVGSGSHQHSVGIGAHQTGAALSQVAPGYQTVTGAASCTGNTMLVAPGFNQAELAIDPPYGHLTASFWTTAPSFNYRTREWAFALPQGAAVTRSWRCLNLETGVHDGHTHNIRKRVKRATVSIPAMPEYVERRIECGSLYKGVLSGFRPVSPANSFTWDHENTAVAPHHLWYLGEDPRPKIRAWRFVNTGGGARTVELGLVCFHDQTT